jgi:hypothetical protein
LFFGERSEVNFHRKGGAHEVVLLPWPSFQRPRSAICRTVTFPLFMQESRFRHQF